MNNLIFLLILISLMIVVPALTIFGSRFVAQYYRQKRLKNMKMINLSSIIEDEFMNPDNPESSQTVSREPNGDVQLNASFTVYPREVKHESK